MPQDILREDVNPGSVLYEWEVREYEKYNRSRRWYIVAGLIGAVLVLYAFATANYLFGLLIILFGIILFLSDMQEPRTVRFAITETGVVLGRKYYKYSELRNFWIIYNPPEVKRIYFSTNSALRHRLQADLFDFDPRPIRDYLVQYLEEDVEQEEEPMSDKLARRLRLY